LKKFDYLILGASGMQGRIVARDLLEKGNEVLLTDIYKENSRKNLKIFPRAAFRYLDVREFRRMIDLIRESGTDIVINCAESDWNLSVHRACLIAGVHVVDMDSDVATTEKQLALDGQFKKKGLTAITGCGSTPGINNLMLNHAAQFFDTLESVNAGFVWDSNMDIFVAPFSIPSIVWEFTHPATVIENGIVRFKKPLSETITVDLRVVGRQTGYLVEHAEVATFNHYFKNKGLKNIHFYAGFPKYSADVFEKLIYLGLAKSEKIAVDEGLKVSPLDLVTQVIKRIDYPENYFEKENLWVEIIGKKDGQPKKILMECIVPPLEGWEDAGCNIDTGFPASIIAQMIKDGRISERGSFSPEAGIVPEEDFFRELRLKGMTVYRGGIAINLLKNEITMPKRAKTERVETYI